MTKMEMKLSSYQKGCYLLLTIGAEFIDRPPKFFISLSEDLKKKCALVNHMILRQSSVLHA